MEIQLTSILFQIVNFGLVFGALVFLLYKPVLKLFEERTQRIAEGQKAAEEAIKEKEKIVALEAKTKKQLERKQAQIMEQAVTEAETEKQRIIDEATKQAELELTRLKQKWVEEKKQLKETLLADLARAVIQVSEKVVQTNLNTKKQQALVDRELAKILKKI